MNKLDKLLNELIKRGVKVNEYHGDTLHMRVNKYITVLGYYNSDELMVMYRNNNGALLSTWYVMPNEYTIQDVVDDIVNYKI